MNARARAMPAAVASRWPVVGAFGRRTIDDVLAGTAGEKITGLVLDDDRRDLAEVDLRKPSPRLDRSQLIERQLLGAQRIDRRALEVGGGCSCAEEPHRA